MRLLKLALAGAVRARPWRRHRAQRRAGENPHVLGGAGRQLGLDRPGEEGPRQASGQVLHARADPLRRHAADDHGDRQQRAGGRQPRLFDARRSRSRTPGSTTCASSPTNSRTAWPATTPTNIYVLQGRPDQEGRGPQGQGDRHQRRRQRRRRRHRAPCCASTASRTSATTPCSRRRSRPCGRCWLEKKADLIPAVLPFSFDPEAAAKIGKVAVRPARGARRHADDRLDGAQVVHRQEPRRHGRFHGGHAAHRALVPRPEEPRRGRARSRPTSPRCRRSGSAGCSPSRTTTAIRTCCRTSTRCSATST